MALNGVDVSGNQPADILSRISYDFAFVKASGNPKKYAWNYKNPYMRQQADDALKKTGLLGLYHFTWGKPAEQEADFFCDVVKPYIGRAILVIDYEAEALSCGREWVRTFIRRVKAKTGVTPIVYASSSAINEQKLVQICKEEGSAIWSANYWLGYQRISGYDYGKCRIGIKDSLVWQYTAAGRLSGYSGDLDLDVFYGTRDDWLRWAGASSKPSNPSNPTTSSPSQSAEKIAEDGYWGNATTKALQKALGKTADGIVSGQDSSALAKVNKGGLLSSSWKTGRGGSPMVRALQKKLGVKDDGYFGPATCKALQNRLGTTADGKVSKPSKMVLELQKKLNDGTF